MPAWLLVQINGAALGSSFTAPTTAGIWELYEHNWSSGTNTVAVIEIINLTTLGNICAGNDFASDDISFPTSPVPFPHPSGSSVPACWD